MAKKIALLLLISLITTPTTIWAQPNPTVEIVLSQPTAQQGDTVTANVYIRNAVNMGGADIGITVDDKCLTIVDRQTGTLLPTTADKGGFSPFAERHDHDTRLAAAVTDRSKIANGDGVFFNAQLKVTCAQGTAQLKVSFAQLASYKDPAAKEIELTSYTVQEGTVTTIDTQLVIGAAGQVKVKSTTAPASVSAVVQATKDSPNAFTSILVPFLVFDAFIFLLIFILVMRRRKRQPQE